MPKPRGYWTFEQCKIEALKYTYKKDFEYYAKGGYLAAKRKNWLDEICVHMKKIGNYKKRCIYVFEFDDNHAYVGLTFNISDRKYRHTVSDKNSPVYKHIKETKSSYNLKQLTDYIEINNSIKKEKEWINQYDKDGWKMLNSVKGGSIGGNILIWTKKACHEEALKYNSRKEFDDNNKGAYLASCRNKWIDEICTHMKPKQQRQKWTIKMDNILKENYGKLTKNKCAKKLGVSVNAITSRINKLNLVTPMDIISDEDINWVINNFETIGAKKCSIKINRPVETIRQIAHRHKLKSPSRWTKKDEHFLIENINKGIEYCANELNKSYKSVLSKCKRIKLKSSERKIWTPQEESFLIENIDKGIDYCCEKLGRSKISVTNKWNKLKKNNKKFGNVKNFT